MRSYLIVDDNRALAENLAEIIRDSGDQAVVAASGPEALHIASRERFDALLTDMRMPAMDGAQLVREMRRQDPSMPSIVITAYSQDAGIRAAQQEGPLAVLPKPVPVPHLLHLLAVARRHGRVLLVEDDAELADNLAEVLQGHGFSVLRAATIAEVDALPTDKPLLAIVDLRVPGAPDGGAVTRVSERFPGVPILVATAFDEVAVPPQARHLFRKPFDTALLVAAVESAHQEAVRA